jgi:aryl-phospho-beta-D-glucosidase BglC (GH1 family)
MKSQQQYDSLVVFRSILVACLASGLTAACSGGKASNNTQAGTGGSKQDPSTETGGAGGKQTPIPASGGAGGHVDAPGTDAAATGGASGAGGAGGVITPPGTGGTPAISGGAGGSAPDGGANLDGSAIPDPHASDAASGSSFLHVEGNKLLDGRGKNVRLTGVNWFGLETNNQSPHGLWARDYRSMVKQIADLGFNTIRLPWANQILRTGATAASVNTTGVDPYDTTITEMNKALVGKSPLEIMDKVIEAAGEFGVKIILDNHSREPDGYMNEQVWYTDKTSEKQWIDDWVFLAKRYAGNTAVVAADLDNEPHGIASWGTGDTSTDWNTAAEKCGNAILAVNPDWVIVVEGTEKVGTDSYWWGGNLSGVKTHPIKLTNMSKLMYSTHEYGPEVHDQDWFSDASFPGNLPALWASKFDFIMQQNLGHILIGEFGIKDRTADGGKAGVWFDTVLSKLGTTYSWTFWCWNPNSGDTEGILTYDWTTPVQWKIDALKPAMAPMIGK